jgi:hypothetical protein
VAGRTSDGPYRGLLTRGGDRSRVSSNCTGLGIPAATLTRGPVLQSLQSVGSVSFGFESEVPIKDAIVIETRALEKIAKYSLEVSAAWSEQQRGARARG